MNGAEILALVYLITMIALIYLDAISINNSDKYRKFTFVWCMRLTCLLIMSYFFGSVLIGAITLEVPKDWTPLWQNLNSTYYVFLLITLFNILRTLFIEKMLNAHE